MSLSVVVFADEADGAGLVWRAVSKLGSLISDLGDVAGGCTNGQTLQFQSSNSTFICATASSSGFTTIASEISPAGNATVLAVNSTGTRASFKTISAGTGIQVNNGSQSVIISSTVVDTDTDTTQISNAPATTAKIIQDNSTSKVTLKSLTAGTGISLTNDTSDVVITSSITQGFTTIASEIATSNNATLIAQNSTGTRASIKTLSAGAGITLINGSQSIVINSTVPAFVLTGANITTSSNTSFLNIWTIPLTKSSGNFISGFIIADSTGVGTAVQFFQNTTLGQSTLNTLGNCVWNSPTSATATVIDQLNATGSQTAPGYGPGTAETNWLNGNATAVTFNCGMLTGPLDDNLIISFRSETAGQSVAILNGSFYFKSP